MTIRRASGTIHNASDDKSYGHNHMEDMNSEKYSRGRRGAPAKGVGRATGARVQIPLSPFFFSKKKRKKLLTNQKGYDRINNRCES